MALPVYSNLLYPMISVYVDLDNNPSTNSLWGIQFMDGLAPFANKNSERFTFGVVTGINYLGTRVTVGQRVAVDKSQAVLVTQGGINYYLTDENTVLITENIPI
jgi:hypothetical protein